MRSSKRSSSKQSVRSARSFEELTAYPTDAEVGKQICALCKNIKSLDASQMTKVRGFLSELGLQGHKPARDEPRTRPGCESKPECPVGKHMTPKCQCRVNEGAKPTKLSPSSRPRLTPQCHALGKPPCPFGKHMTANCTCRKNETKKRGSPKQASKGSSPKSNRSSRGSRGSQRSKTSRTISSRTSQGSSRSSGRSARSGIRNVADLAKNHAALDNLFIPKHLQGKAPSDIREEDVEAFEEQAKQKFKPEKLAAAAFGKGKSPTRSPTKYDSLAGMRCDINAGEFAGQHGLIVKDDDPSDIYCWVKLDNSNNVVSVLKTHLAYYSDDDEIDDLVGARGDIVSGLHSGSIFAVVANPDKPAGKYTVEVINEGDEDNVTAKLNENQLHVWTARGRIIDPDEEFTGQEGFINEEYDDERHVWEFWPDDGDNVALKRWQFEVTYDGGFPQLGGLGAPKRGSSPNGSPRKSSSPKSSKGSRKRSSSPRKGSHKSSPTSSKGSPKGPKGSKGAVKSTKALGDTLAIRFARDGAVNYGILKNGTRAQPDADGKYDVAIAVADPYDKTKVSLAPYKLKPSSFQVLSEVVRVTGIKMEPELNGQLGFIDPDSEVTDQAGNKRYAVFLVNSLRARNLKMANLEDVE